MIQLGFLWIIVQCVNGIQKVVSTSFTQTTSFSDHQGWHISNRQNQGHSSCNGVQLFGGDQEFDLSTGIVKLFNLEPHYKLYLSLQVYIIDMTSSQAINIQVDQQHNQFILPISSIDLCGGYQVDQNQTIILTQPHSFPTAIISIFSSIDSSNVYWGIRDFELSIEICPYGCQICFSDSQIFECSQWKLFHQSWSSKDFSDFNNDGWQTTSVSGPTQCASIPMYGGYNSMSIGGTLQKTFELRSHSNLYLIFRFIKIDGWNGEYGSLKVNNEEFKTLYNGFGFQKNYCGDPNYADQFYIHGINYYHDSASIKVIINSEQYNSARYYGIRDFYIYGYTISSYCGDGVIDESEQCDDGNIFGFDGCFNCQYSCMEGCSNCINGICFDCQNGWEFDILNHQCIQQQFNQLDQQLLNLKQNNIKFIYNQELDCVQYNQQLQCIKCSYGYYLNENGNCDSFCGDGIVRGSEQCEIGQKNCNNFCHYKCQVECDLCIFGKCQQCKAGYILQNSECIPKCGDYWVQNDEECDDGNIVRFDGCHSCKDECQDSCLFCKLGQCITCQQGWMLINGYCESKCGDSQIAKGYEECDDGNDIQFDGCYNCKLECPDQGCSACYLGVCYNCNHPLTLYQDQCLVICGDGLQAAGYEDCDDGNDIPYDGCYKCKYQCYKECKSCDKGVCIDECDYGYYMVNLKCISQCGDGITTFDEQCDDGNSIEYDGCYECNFSCPQNCQICEEGKCSKCNYGYYLSDQQCVTKCGDGLIGYPNEECDDFNSNNQDGCSSNCFVETDWVCTQPSEDSFTQCQYIIAPVIKLKYLNQEYDCQFIQLTFTQKVKTYVENYTSYINATILNLSLDAYTINIIEDVAANLSLQNVNYVIKIQIFETQQTDLVFQIDLKEQLYNEIDMELLQLQSNIKLNLPKLLNKNQLTVSSQLQAMNKIILYLTCSIGLIYLFFGKVGVFLDILDILQQQSYLKYINVEIPQNLKIYYDSSNVISFQPLLQYLNINTISSNYMDQHYIEARYKFKEYEVNADIVANVQLFLLIIITILFSRMFFKQILKQLYRINVPIILQFQFKIYSSVTLVISKLYFNFAKQGLQVIVYSNSFDLLFSSCIQLSVYCDFYRQLFAVWIIIITTTVIIQSKKNRQQNSVIMIKKLAYILILVFYQSCQIVQSILLSLIQTFYLTYLLIQQKSISIQFVKQITAEISILLTILMNCCYWDELVHQFNYQYKVNISWSQIGLLSLSLATIIIIEAYNSILNIYKKIEQNSKRRMSQAKFPFEQMIV